VQASRVERFTDVAIVVFLWAFRVAVILIVVVGSFLTITSGRFGVAAWLDLAINGLVLGSIYALIALGYTMVYGILRMINFAHGEIMMSGAVGGYFSGVFLASTGFLNANPLASLVAIVLMILVAATIAVGISLLVERIAYRPLRNAPRLVPLISAIGASFVLQYSFRGFLGPGIYAYPAVSVLSERLPLPFDLRVIDVVIIVSAVVMMAGLYLFVMRTRYGTAMRAVSEDQQTARLMGINVDRTIMLTFGIGAAMAGAAGVLYGLLFTQIYFFMGFYPGIKAFTAAVLGGIGNIPGAMLGGIFLGEVEAIGPILFLDGLGVPSTAQLRDVVAFTLLVLILVFRPSGLLGERVARQRA
jgi:branched-chain amino acid transport system permease protein